MRKGASDKMFDLVIHVGDFAYDMYEENGKRGDDFMAQIEPIASSVPYMTCPGTYILDNTFCFLTFSYEYQAGFYYLLD